LVQALRAREKEEQLVHLGLHISQSTLQIGLPLQLGLVFVKTKA